MDSRLQSIHLREPMAKLKHLFLAITVLTITAQAQYPVQYVAVDSVTGGPVLPASFPSQTEAMGYIARLTELFQSLGFITASVDSTRFDSSSATVHYYLGKRYRWTRIRTDAADFQLLEAVRWNSRLLEGAPVNFQLVQTLQQRLLDYMEEHGHPFAKIHLDSFEIAGEEVSALMKIVRGPLYTIDSIRVYGDAKIDNEFLQRYLDIKNKSIYNRKKLDQVTRRIAELSYVQEERVSNLSLLGTGSVLNLYLKQKKSSQVNVLVGFLPNSDATSTKKFLITGDAN